MIRNSHVEIGSDPEQNELIKENISEAVEFELAKLNSGCGYEDDSLIGLLIYLLKSYIFLIAPLITTFLGSTVGGLLEGLSTGLSENELVGGLLGAVEGALHGMNTGSLSGFSDYLKATYT